MVLGTYANLYAMEESTNAKLAVTNKPLVQINNLPLNVIKDDLHIIPNIPDSLELIPRAKGIKLFKLSIIFVILILYYIILLIFHYITDKINQLPEINLLDKTLDVKVKDVRQEPPIPVERMSISEKPNIEKSDKIAVDSLVSEIKNIVETIKNDNLKAQSQDDTNILKIDESATLKAEEKIKIIEEKEQSIDLQKNDNLINLDAIKKEESELAADGEIANARAAERHEQLRKTLEKHKLEQRQMMQEQKEILKDIKEQKQEFEREKQRMAKDEILKKNEKIQIDTKENVLLENKNDMKETDKKVVENNEVIIEKNNENVLKEKEWNNVDEIKLNIKQQPPDENNNINIAVEVSKKKLDPSHEISQDKNVEGSQKILENAPDEFLLIKEAVDHEIPEKPLQKEKQEDETKVERIEFNDSKNMKGPILNVLSKSVPQRSVMEEGLAKENDYRQTKEETKKILMNEVANASDKLQEKYDNKYSVPIALKMTNQSKLDKIIVPSLNKSEPEVLAIHRDILENNEREKRDVDREVNANDTKVNSDLLSEKSKPHVEDTDDADSETCSKLQKSSKKSEVETDSEKRVIKSSTTEVPLINTNLYLSEQRITKTISMDQHAALDSEYMSMKQEDSKVLSPKDKTEI